MILGIGFDLCNVERVRRSLKRLGDAWLGELFSDDERAHCMAAYDPALQFARAFCGKEACAKALGTGFADEVGWLDIEVLPPCSGPRVRLHQEALARLVLLTPVGHESRVDVAFGGDARLARAIVLMTAIPIARL